MEIAAQRISLRKRLGRRFRLSSPTRRIRFSLATRALERRARGRSLRLLDAGCSDALLTEKIALRHPGWLIDAADIDGQALEVAACSLETAGVGNVRLLERDLTEPLGEATYDAVLVLECLSLVPDDEAALSSMATALEPGGILLAHVADKNWPGTVKGRTTWGEVRPGYTLEELRAKLERAGLTFVAATHTSRSLARFGSDLGFRMEHMPGLVRLAWFPLAMAIAWLDRHHVSWGAPTGLFVEARR